MTQLTDKFDLARAQQQAPPFGTWFTAEPGAVVLVYQTSGTTGTPIRIPLTAADAEAWTEIGVRAYTALGVTAETTVVTTLATGPFAAGHTHVTLDRIGATVIPIRPGDSDAALAALEDADTFLGTPSFALHLADRITDAPGIRRLILGGEPGAGLLAVRRRLQAAFDAEVREVAGIGEVAPSLFAECEPGDGMHFMGGGHVDMEVLETGELVYTASREALPLRRYNSHDVAEVTATGCSCGRPGPKLRIVGRSDDAFHIRGVTVHPSAVQAVVAEFAPAVTGRARVVLPEEGMVRAPVPVEVEASGAAPAGDIATALHSRLSFRAEVRLVPPSQFGPAGYKTALVRRVTPRPAR